MREDTLIGRNKELEVLFDWLKHNRIKQRPIFFLHSKESLSLKGGVGKTRLIRHFSREAEQLPGVTLTLIDFQDVSNRNSVTIAEQIVENARAAYPDWNPSTFDLALDEYKKNLSSSEPLSYRRGEELLQNIRFALVQDFSVLHLSTEERLVVIFDTFEEVEHDLSLVLFKNAPSFPDAYDCPLLSFIVIGRNPPNWSQPNWAGQKEQIESLALGEFSQAELVLYCRQQIPDRYHLQVMAHADRLYELTQGRPILLSLFASLLSDVDDEAILAKLLKADVRTFEKELAQQINNVVQLVNLPILAMAHIYHRFHKHLFFRIFDDLLKHHLPDAVKAEEVWKKLLKLDFVRSSWKSETTDAIEEIVLHDEMRDLVNKYNWPEFENKQNGGLLRRDLSESVINYYDREIEFATDLRTQQTYRVEQLYHKLFFAPSANWESFDTLFEEALGHWELAYARLLWREAYKFYPRFSTYQRARLLFLEIRLLRKEERFQEALASCLTLEETASMSVMTSDIRAFLFEKGECYRFLGRLPEALETFGRLLDFLYARSNDLYPERRAETLSRMANIYQQQADFERAAQFYVKSIDILKTRDVMRYADTLNYLCLVLCQQGKIEEAYLKSLIALKICRGSPNKATSMILPDSLYVLGTIQLCREDFTQAQRFFEEAREAFERHQNKKGMAKVYYALGDLELKQKKVTAAIARLWFDRAYKIALLVDREIEMQSLYKLAQIDTLSDKQEDAIAKLQGVIKIARETGNLYHEVEARLELAGVLDENGQQEESDRLQQELFTQTNQSLCYSLFGRAAYKKACLRFYQQAYQQAFEQFGWFCYWMTEFSDASCEQVMSEAVAYLFELDQPSLLDAWNTFQHFLAAHMPRSPQRAECLQKALADIKAAVEAVY